jgi:hypothetical protein
MINLCVEKEAIFILKKIFKSPYNWNTKENGKTQEGIFVFATYKRQDQKKEKKFGKNRSRNKVSAKMDV